MVQKERSIDGIGGNIKRIAKDACLWKTADINSASKFYDWEISEEVKQQLNRGN